MILAQIHRLLRDPVRSSTIIVSEFVVVVRHSAITHLRNHHPLISCQYPNPPFLVPLQLHSVARHQT